ncbi:MAG: SsrA-binding protein [Thermomicrobiales bacterium]|jgi:SsrA-binding protein|nr:SsrA-binding protein [Thermomicrobiales bacterium]MEA2585426.1 SsrA-binding protein [Thermomicrobiales bacterium]
MATKTDAKTTKQERRADRVVTTNRRAFHEYFIVETIETGIVLSGTEIKSIREGKISITEAYARIDDGELWLAGSRISPYSHGSYTNHEPDRPRKLLAHRSQIQELRTMIEQKGMTIVPLRVLLKQGKAKVELGVARGKKLYDKRATEAEREATRDVQRALRERE